MTLEYRCSNCGSLLQTTNADPLHDEIEQLRAKLRLIAFSIYEPIEGTRSGTVMLTVEEMRSIREMVGATPLSSGERSRD
jgi:hypothetical protein